MHHVAVLFVLALTASWALASTQAPFRPDIPRVWDDEAIADMEIPLPEPAPRPRHVSAAYYYSIPELTLYKSYPLVPPAQQAEHLKWLEQQEPVIAFDPARLRTEKDWLEAARWCSDRRSIPFLSSQDAASATSSEPKDGSS